MVTDIPTAPPHQVHCQVIWEKVNRNKTNSLQSSVATEILWICFQILLNLISFLFASLHFILEEKLVVLSVLEQQLFDIEFTE